MAMHFEYVVIWGIILALFLINQDTDGGDDDHDDGMFIPAYQQGQ